MIFLSFQMHQNLSMMKGWPVHKRVVGNGFRDHMTYLVVMKVLVNFLFLA